MGVQREGARRSSVLPPMFIERLCVPGPVCALAESHGVPGSTGCVLRARP